jgi:D-psicose/D-tagatose/L-ribulose 3-epimerase
MKIGVNTFLWSSNFGPGDFGVLPEIRSHGFHGIEVTLIRPAEFKASAIRRRLEEIGLECTVCSILPRELSAISEDAAVRAQTKDHLSECIRATADAGARILAGPLYAPVGFFTGTRRTSDEWQRAVDFYRSLQPILSENGVDLFIEPLNRFETYFLNTTFDAVRLCEQVDQPNVGILWDSFHANIEEKKPPASLRSAGRHLKHVHACENDRGAPGSGHIDWEGIFQALRAINYQGWLTIESFGFALGDLSAAASIWRDLAETPACIAWEGQKFLRSWANRSADVPNAQDS